MNQQNGFLVSLSAGCKHTSPKHHLDHSYTISDSHERLRKKTVLNWIHKSSVLAGTGIVFTTKHNVKNHPLHIHQLGSYVRIKATTSFDIIKNYRNQGRLCPLPFADADSKVTYRQPRLQRLHRRIRVYRLGLKQE